MAITATNSMHQHKFDVAVWSRNAGVAVAGTLFLAVCSHISTPLPWTLVPLNLQPFGVVLLALLFGPNMAAATAALYLVEGAAGLPVFSPHGPGGLAQILGPSGGYLMSYPAAAWLAGRLRGPASFARNLTAGMVGDLLVLLSGFAWISVAGHISAKAAFAAGVAPFLPGDFLKCVAAAGIAAGYFAWRRRDTNRDAAGIQ